jgi:hypothetical protein
MREVARMFRVSPSVVQRWVERAGGQRLDRVEWSGKTTSTNCPANRTARDIEEQLGKSSDLGEHGAEAILVAMADAGVNQLSNHYSPSIPTSFLVMASRSVNEVTLCRCHLPSFSTPTDLLVLSCVQTALNYDHWAA